MEGLGLGDARQGARAKNIVEAMERNPAAGFPTAMRCVAEREGAYRFLNNDRVDLDALLAPHAAQTVKRAAALAERPLVVLDKTALIFTGESDRDDLERLGVNRQ